MSEGKFMKSSLANKSVVERVVDQITNAIINGELKPGDKIPTEPELCETFGVGRNSIREAIKVLEAYGVLEIRRAEGTFIRQDYNYKMLYPILYGIILQKDSQGQIVNLRKVIDIGILQVAVKAMGDKEIGKLQEILQTMRAELEKDQPSPTTIFDIDVTFHSAIVNVLDNALLESIGYYVDKITRSTRVMAIINVLEHGDREEFIELHQEIIDMLKSKKEDTIFEIVQKHYKYWK
ncbi:MAG: putative transcriptional regulator [Clostridia bacterium]|jgi:GntR family transcriptional repressor for pyruvate dehydrogenase complex|nr:putative transcriptional regulator [Clostridia bacterium]